MTSLKIHGEEESYVKGVLSTGLKSRTLIVKPKIYILELIYTRIKLTENI